MKCSNPGCNRGLGLVAYRRGLLGKRRYCSTRCRDTFVVAQPKQSQQERSGPSYFDWLFQQPIENPRATLLPAVVRVRSRSNHF